MIIYNKLSIVINY